MASGTQLQVRANDFERQWCDIREPALQAVERVGRSGWLILGGEVSAFERELAEWWGVEHAVGVASGMDALEIALRCTGLPRGARVLTTPLSAFATTLAILRAGGEPVWCDVDDSGALDLEQAGEALRRDRSIRAVMPVHLYGHPMDPTALRALAAEHGVPLVEDCAQSAGAWREGRPTGSSGPVAATSFYPTKNLGAMGDAGALLTADPAIAERARQLRDYGQSSRYRHVEEGLNSRLDELHAAILRSASLPRLAGWLARRGEIAQRYTRSLQGTALRPIAALGGRSAHHLYPVEVLEGSPEQLAQRLAERGVAVGRHYPFLAPDQPAARGRGVVFGELAVARRLAERELSLPIHPYLQDMEVEHVIESCLQEGA
jgi:dTDP-3-amino-3,4,6-trideoxy-alpha-D-glucose transaminase